MAAGRGIAPDLHLHALEAAGAVTLGLAGEIVDRFAFLVEPAAGVGLDPIAASAEEAIERQFGDLAGDVPKRNDDAADRVHHDAAAAELPSAREHLLPQPFDQQRVFPGQHGPQHLFDGGPGGAAADPCLADPDHALVRLDLDEETAAARLHAAGAAIGRVAAIGERDRADIDDLHDLSPRPGQPADRIGSASAA